MSIAYQTVVLFVFVLPGIIFRKRLSTAGQFRQSRSLTEELAQSVLWAIAFHSLWVGLAQLLPTPDVNLDAAFMHAMGQYGPNAAGAERAVRAVTNHFPYVVSYFLTINVAAFLLGSWLRSYRDRPRSTGWMNSWHRILDWIEDHEPANQRFREWTQFLDLEPTDTAVIRVLTAVVEYGKAPFLLVGTLIEPVFGPDGNPERFVLQNVMRRPLLPESINPAEALNEDGFYDIRGDRFVLRASEAKTLNIVFKYLQQAESEETELNSGGAIEQSPSV